MGIVIGIDEAGLGPNLGPFVVAATIWEVPGSPHDFDFWSTLDNVIDQDGADLNRLHIADSKVVFQPHRGMERLEESVLTAWNMASKSHSAPSLEIVGRNPITWHEALSFLGIEFERFQHEPWSDSAWSIPVDACSDRIEQQTSAWASISEKSNLKLIGVLAEVVSPQEFNRGLDRTGNKAALTSELHFSLLKRAWTDRSQPTLVASDKHGGRNRYADLVTELADGEFVCCLGESAEMSRYRVGHAEFRFQPRAECHLPVALASMVAKYLREVSMLMFNRFWSQKQPHLKPTQGYPQDAKRFRKEIEQLQEQLKIPDQVLWRNK